MPFAGEKEEECVEERQLCLYRKHKSCLLINFHLAGFVTWLLRLLKQLIFTQSGWFRPRTTDAVLLFAPAGVDTFESTLIYITK